MKFLRADYEIEVRHHPEKRIASRLRHAAEKTENGFRAPLRDLSQHPHFPERLLLRHVADAAGVQEHDVGVGLPFRPLIPARQQRMRDLF